MTGEASRQGIPEFIGNVFVRYTFNDKDTSGTVQYYGFTISDTQWLILQIDATNAIQPYRYANLSNNTSRTSYKTASTGAWAQRASLTYGYFSDLTGV